MNPDADEGLDDPLDNLSKIQSRMDNLHILLSDSLTTNTIIPQSHMQFISNEITHAINQLILNGTALVSFSQSTSPSSDSDFKSFKDDDDDDVGCLRLSKTEEDEEVVVVVDDDDHKDIVELDAVELLAEHLHFCDFCGKGFKRDANLRMHMRAHGNKFKTLEALAKPEKSSGVIGGRTRFSCPFNGCTRNKLHKKFRPLKSVICVKNHFKRSHCPKMYSCNRCNKKNFSVLADLKSHLKHCGGETKWKCSCGTSFSRKDKLFGHMALFEGHMPAVPEDEMVKGASAVAQAPLMEWGDVNGSKMDDMIFDGLGSIGDDFCMQEFLGTGSDGGFDWNL